MSAYLALILTVLTLLTGVVVALNRFTWKVDERKDHSVALNTLVEYSRSFFPVLLIVLVIRSFVFEPFRIPGDPGAPQRCQPQQTQDENSLSHGLLLEFL